MAYVTNVSGNSVSVIDTATRAVTAIVPGVAFTASFGATTKTSPGSFGIQISYTPAQPSRPYCRTPAPLA